MGEVYIPSNSSTGVDLAYLQENYPTYSFVNASLGNYAPLSGAVFTGGCSGTNLLLSGEISGSTGIFSSGLTGATGSFSSVTLGSLNAGRATVTQITSDTTAVTINASSGYITTVSLSLAAAGGLCTFTVNNSYVSSSSVIVASISGYNASYYAHGFPVVTISNVSNGSFEITICNINASNALSGYAVVSFICC